MNRISLPSATCRLKSAVCSSLPSAVLSHASGWGNGMLDAISAYHDLLSDDQLAADSHAMLNDQLARQGLVFGGRPLCTVLRPRLTNHERHAWLEQRVRVLMRVFAK